MALYSVWDWDRNSYKVYGTKTRVSVGDDPKPPRPAPIHRLGAVPDTEVKLLPRAAQFVGHSHMARGEIVRARGSGLGSADESEPTGPMGFWSGVVIGTLLGWVVARWVV